MACLIKPEFKLDQRFKKTVASRYGRYEFRAGILKDKTYRSPRPARRGLATVAGGPVRTKSRRTRGTVSQVGERIRRDLNVPYLTAPFARRTRAMREFLKAFADLVQGKPKARKRAEDTLQEVIRAPIREQRYGRNSALRARVKRFNRKLFDTGQFYLGIIAQVRNRRV